MRVVQVEVPGTPSHRSQCTKMHTQPIVPARTFRLLPHSVNLLVPVRLTTENSHCNRDHLVIHLHVPTAVTLPVMSFEAPGKRNRDHLVIYLHVPPVPTAVTLPV